MTNILEVRNLDKYYGENNAKVHVLKNLSFSIEGDEFVAVMGPSGSGKSTLLFAISGMDTVDRGDVIFKNQRLKDLNEKEISNIRRNEMGFVFQDANFIKELPIIDNIVLPAFDDYKWQKDELYHKAHQIMKTVGIGDLKDRMISEVSGGQLQRASICRAILHNPPILFADEPTGALNSQSSKEVLDLFVELNKSGTTIIVVTHDAKVASRAKRILFMKDGEIIKDLKFKNENTFERLEIILKEMSELKI